VIDGQRTIKGVVKGKQEAKAEYDAAVNKGKTAALLSQDNVESEKDKFLTGVFKVTYLLQSFPAFPW
ncbi:MAG TPA: VIT domain-containing protein, partial [Chlamydiales bacterium]|jgi:hypothetical protein|nr:VIT domain-containing protein [Chlamydiales bacterium]